MQQEGMKFAGGHVFEHNRGIRSLEVVFAGTSGIGSWNVSIYCMYVCIQGLLNSCVERLKAESGRGPPSIHG